ncbi:signal-regulatory protein beta-1 isoform X2 [Protopterus annectens]|uniref:signal-regulatory protein beta-1 isoform X2 n=1 Tax=Protopterus annectens TaxID=7888 RepID=UPI001CF9F3FD|nr:signal-regulatory protein beta-1 isoform X2 [Protopterus annectens]
MGSFMYWRSFELVACSFLIAVFVIKGDAADLVIKQEPDVFSEEKSNAQLNCTLSHGGLVGAVRWYKKAKHSQDKEEDFFSDQISSANVSWNIKDGRNTDFSITIKDVRFTDSGNYVCRKLATKPISGNPLTSLWVYRGSLKLTAPDNRVKTGDAITFNCKIAGFFPSSTDVVWEKNNAEIPISERIDLKKILTEDNNPELTSTISIVASKEDIKSSIKCRIKHPNLNVALNATYDIGRSIQVSPSVKIDPPNPKAIMNTTIKLTCIVDGFYPKSAQTIKWFENNALINGSNEDIKEETDGSFSMNSTLEVYATQKRDNSEYKCEFHYGPRPEIIDAKVVLSVDESMPNLLWFAVAAGGGVLLIIIIVVIVVVVKRKRKTFISNVEYATSVRKKPRKPTDTLPAPPPPPQARTRKNRDEQQKNTSQGQRASRSPAPNCPPQGQRASRGPAPNCPPQRKRTDQ